MEANGIYDNKYFLEKTFKNECIFKRESLCFLKGRRKQYNDERVLLSSHVELEEYV